MDKENGLPKRKPTRLNGFDYSTHGAYFVTICSENRKNTFSSIVGEGSPLPQLTKCGEILDRWIQEIPVKYPNVSVDVYVIMPDHVHMLLFLCGDNGRGNPSPTEKNGIGAKIPAVHSVVGWWKYQVTKEIRKILPWTGEKIFQRSFHDHIIRNLEDYNEVKKYILENPMRWYYDELHKKEEGFAPM